MIIPLLVDSDLGQSAEISMTRVGYPESLDASCG